MFENCNIPLFTHNLKYIFYMHETIDFITVNLKFKLLF